MLLTNLSTRPFYNLRLVQAIMGTLAAIVLGSTVFNVVMTMRLTASERSLGARSDEAEREAARLRRVAAEIRAQIDPKDLQVVADAAREANAIIDRRAFSWTELFEQLEATLPGEVRITAVQPRLEKDRFVVAVRAEARRAEDLDAFIEALEMRSTFKEVLATQTQANERGFLETLIQGTYVAATRREIAPEPIPASGVARREEAPQ